jgi:hypothetical protein
VVACARLLGIEELQDADVDPNVAGDAGGGSSGGPSAIGTPDAPPSLAGSAGQPTTVEAGGAPNAEDTISSAVVETPDAMTPEPCPGEPSVDCPRELSAGRRCEGSRLLECSVDERGCLQLVEASCTHRGNERCVGSYPSSQCEHVFGFPDDAGGSGQVNAEFLIAERVEVDAPVTVQRIGILSRTAEVRVRLALYADDAGAPGAWRASAVLSTQVLAAGRNEYAINDAPELPVQLPAGVYWLVAVFDGQVSVANGGAPVPFRYRAWVPWNTPFPSNGLESSTPDSLAPVGLYLVALRSDGT